jgi:hypothetical protein
MGRAEGEVVGLEVGDYFTEGYWRRDSSEGVRGKVGGYHRTLSTYVGALVGSGLTIERMLEPRATGRFAEFAPIYESVPVVLVARCKKA